MPDPTEPLSDDRLAEIRARVTAEVTCPAAHPDEADKDHLWVTGSLSGRDHCGSCSVSRRVVDADKAVLLAEVDRLQTESERRLGELLFWHFEYREAMDNFRGENWQIGQLRADRDAAVAALQQVREAQSLGAALCAVYRYDAAAAPVSEGGQHV
jgi:hypothetical protein